MSAVRKTAASLTLARHPVRPREEKIDVEAAHEVISRRFAKVLAELAK